METEGDENLINTVWFSMGIDPIYTAGAAAEGGAGGAIAPQYSSRGGLAPPPPNKIGAMTTECVLLLHALDAFQNVLYTTTHIYTRADYSSSTCSPSLYCKLLKCVRAYVLYSLAEPRLLAGGGVAPRGIHNLAPPTPNCCRRLCTVLPYCVIHKERNMICPA